MKKLTYLVVTIITALIIMVTTSLIFAVYVDVDTPSKMGGRLEKSSSVSCN